MFFLNLKNKLHDGKIYIMMWIISGAIAVAECIADNPTLLRIDLRDNPDVKSAGLLALNLAIKMNTTITTVNLDRTCCQPANSRVKLSFFFHIFIARRRNKGLIAVSIIENLDMNLLKHSR